MIWKIENIKDKITSDRLNTHVTSTAQLSKSNDRKIAIIGGGPKGIYGLERLLAQISSSQSDKCIEIHVFNENSHIGSGNNYRVDQPEYLLINYSIGNINMWIDEKPFSTASNTLTLLDWINLFKSGNELALETDYASRALVGLYLQYGLSEMLQGIPSHVKVKLIIGNVNDIIEVDGKYNLAIDGKLLENSYDQILLATGHSNRYKTLEELAYKNLASRNEHTFFIPHVYPVQKTLLSLPKQLKVAIKGMGLTFIDATLALTEGRGGTFTRENGNLIYHPSGEEPAEIFPYSRGGFPMLPRGPLSQKARYKTQYFTQAFVANIKEKYSKSKIDFEKILLPVIEQEYRYAYYSIWMKNMDYVYPKDLPYLLFEKEILKFREIHKEVPDFTMAKFLSPGQHINVYDDQDWHKYIVNYLVEAIQEAKKGELNSPLMAAVAVWREITPLISPLYEFGGFTPGSQKIFDHEYYGKFSNVTYGPPIENVEKIVALAKASLVNFSLKPSPEVICMDESGNFKIQNAGYPLKVEGNCLIDARIAKPTLNEGVSEIYKKLIQRNISVPFENESYNPGCLKISPEGYIINSQGDVNPNIALTGTPTEGATLDNDTLSRTRNNIVSAWAKAIVQNNTSSAVDSSKH